MKKRHWFLSIIIIVSLNTQAQHKTNNDSLTRAQFIPTQTAKADSLNKLALSLATPNASSGQLNKAINNIMQGLHIYSKFRDTDGLRRTFDHLGLVYQLQKKYTQAKWFILQSNTLSRERRDTPQIINSLINLASVKKEIKDFKLADRDILEADMLTKTLKEEANRKAMLESEKAKQQITAQQKPIPQQAKNKQPELNTYNYIFIGIILVIIILMALWVVFSYNRKRKL